MKDYLYKVKKYIILQVVLDFIGVICLALTPLIQKWLFDYGLQSTSSQIILAILLYALLLGIYSLMQYFCILVAFKSGISFETRLKKNFFDKIFNMNSKVFHEKPIGEYISIQSNDITTLEQDYLQPIVDVIRSVNMMLIYGVIIFMNINYKIGLVVVLSSIFAILIPKIFGKMLDNSRSKYQRHLGKYTSTISDLLEGFGLINSKTIENIKNRHNEILHKTADKRYEFGKKKALVLGLSDLMTKMVRAFTFAIVGYLFYKKEITVGVAIATLSYSSAFIDPIDSLLYDITAIRSVNSTKQNILSFLNKKSETENKRELENFKNELIFDNVNLTIDKLQLEDINLKIEKGKKYAIIGKSGAGKSTFLNLLLGIHKPNNGEVIIDGENVRELNLSNTLLYMSQHEHIYRASVKENVRELNLSNTLLYMSQHEHIYRASVKENVTVFDSYSYDYIPDNANEVAIIKDILGRNITDCSNFSGGEKRVLALLRILCRKGEILVLDEPFTGVDTESILKLEDILLKSDQTVLVVTHNTSIEHLKKFDNVIRVEDGKVYIEN